MNWRDDKVLLVLAFFLLFFTSITLAVLWLRPDDRVTQNVFFGLSNGAWSALLLYLKIEKPLPPGSVITTESKQITKTPPTEKEVTGVEKHG